MNREPIIIAATRRSGSTWLMNLLNAGGRLRTVFEPLHTGHVPEFSIYRSRQYLRADNSEPWFRSPMERLLRGEISNTWTEALNRDSSPKDGLLIKFVRANLLLGWLRMLSPEAKLVFLIRHPFAVANSSMRYKWPIDLRMYTNQPELMLDHLAPFQEIMDGARTDFEKHVVSWCVETRVPLLDLPRDAYLPVFFEPLKQDPRTAVPELFHSLGLPVSDSVWTMLEQPSTVTQADSREALRRGEDMTQRWRKFVTPEEEQTGWRIVDAFGLGELYPWKTDASARERGFVPVYKRERTSSP